MDAAQELKAELVRICRCLQYKNLVAATDGNVSVRRDDQLLITPSGLNKGFLRESDILTLDLEGNVLAGQGAPTSELKMHLTAYHQRPDIRAVVHAHPPVATACTIAGISLEIGVLPEVLITLGAIPTAAYATPGTEMVSAVIRELVLRYDAVLLAHHGALTLGRNLMDAYNKMEKVEHAALIVFTAHQLGQVQPLPPAEVKKLVRLGIEKGLRPPAAGNLWR